MNTSVTAGNRLFRIKEKECLKVKQLFYYRSDAFNDGNRRYL